MKHVVLIVLLTGALTTGCQASDAGGAANPAAPPTKPAEAAVSGHTLREEIFERAKKRKGGAEPTQLDLLNELMQKGAEQAGAVKDFGEPRFVARGAKPEIIVQGDSFYINGKHLKIGDSLLLWKSALGGGSRCKKQDLVVSCMWDQLGVEVGAYPDAPDLTSGIQISLNLEPTDPLFPRPRPSYLVTHPFSGYLELDGYGIDAQTKFWEIRASVDPKRNLRCNPRDCSHPHGRFSDTANLYLRLNSASEYGNLYELSISSDEGYKSAPKR